MKYVGKNQIAEMRGIFFNRTDSLGIDETLKFEKTRTKELEKIGIGGIVYPSKYGFGNGVFMKWRKGKIIGWGKDNNYVRVQINGQKSIGHYWCGFWEGKGA